MLQLRRTQSFFNRPSITIAVIHSLIWNTQFSCPSSNRLGFSVKGNHSTLSTVTALLKRSSPSTVGRFVVAAVVNAINRMLRRRLGPHVSKELFKGGPPLINLNSTTTVARIFSIVRILAPLAHIPIAEVFPAERHAVRSASTNRFSLQASTGTTCSVPQGGLSNSSPNSALTAAKPNAAMSNVFTARLKQSPAANLSTYKSIMFHGRSIVT